MPYLVFFLNFSLSFVIFPSFSSSLLLIVFLSYQDTDYSIKDCYFYIQILYIYLYLYGYVHKSAVVTLETLLPKL